MEDDDGGDDDEKKQKKIKLSIKRTECVSFHGCLLREGAAIWI